LSYAQTLALGTTSPLTPQQKYEQAKKDLAGITAVINDSLASKEDKAAAVSKLPDAISNFLETSKVFNASSEAFQQDYAYSQKLLLDNSNKLSSQISVEEEQLSNLKKQVISLGAIDTNTLTIAQGVKNLIDAVAKSQSVGTGVDPNLDNSNFSFVKSTFAADSKLATVADSGIDYYANRISSGITSREELVNSISVLSKVAGWYNKVLNRPPEVAGLQYWFELLTKSGATERQVKEWFAYGAAKELGTSTLPDINSFAKGGFASGLSLVGEEGPEFVDFTNPGRVYSKGQSESMFSEFGGNLAQEVRALREEVKQLRKENREDSDSQIRNNAACSQESANSMKEAMIEISSREEFNRRNTAKFE
jgi:hypothetical protein